MMEEILTDTFLTELSSRIDLENVPPISLGSYLGFSEADSSAAAIRANLTLNPQSAFNMLLSKFAVTHGRKRESALNLRERFLANGMNGPAYAIKAELEKFRIPVPADEETLMDTSVSLPSSPYDRPEQQPSHELPVSTVQGASSQSSDRSNKREVTNEEITNLSKLLPDGNYSELCGILGFDYSYMQRIKKKHFMDSTAAFEELLHEWKNKGGSMEDLDAALIKADLGGLTVHLKRTRAPSVTRPLSKVSGDKGESKAGASTDDASKKGQTEIDVEEAIRNGTAPWNRSRIMVVGPAGVGKTSLIRRLTGQEFNPHEKSTKGAEENVVTNNKVSNWKVVNEAKTAKADLVQSIALDRDSRSNRLAATDRLVTGDADRSVSEKIANISQSITREEITNVESSELGITYSMWDFGGQEIYYITHPLFLSWRSLYILVIPLHLELSDKAPRERDAGNAQKDLKGSAVGTHRTILDAVNFWLMSVYTHAVPDSHLDSNLMTKHKNEPKVLLIGTFAGDEDTRISKEKVDSKVQELKHFIQSKPYQDQVLFPICVIDNQFSPTSEVNAIQNCIDEHIKNSEYMKVQKPVRWRTFLTEIEGSDQNTLTVTEARSMMNSLGINDDDEMNVLKFYHDIGHLIFHQGCELIVLKPQFLNSIVSSIITVIDDKKMPGVSPQSWKDLEAKGILSIELIQAVWEEHGGDLKQLDNIIDLMIMFDLICEIPVKDGGPRRFFIPCRSSPMLHKKECHDDKGHTVRFTIDFQDFLPDGFLHRFCVRMAKWSVEKRETTKPIFKPNSRQMMLHIDGLHNKVVMTFEINNEECREIKIIDDLRGILEDLKERWAKRIKYSIDELVGATAWVQVHEEQTDTQNIEEEGKEEEEVDYIGMESLPHVSVPGEENVKPIKMECRERVGQDGGKLKLDSFGIELEIPPGAIDCEAPQDISLSVLTYTPNLGNSNEEMSVCFGVQCLAPDDLIIKLPVTYTIPHCAVITGTRDSGVKVVLYTGEGEYSTNAVVKQRIILSTSGIPSCTIGKDVLKLEMNHFSWLHIAFTWVKDLYLGRKKMWCWPFIEKELAWQKTPVILHAHLYDDIKGNSELIEREEGEQQFGPAVIKQHVLIHVAEGDLNMTCHVKKTQIRESVVVSLEKLMGGVRICEQFVLDLPNQPGSVFVALNVGQNERLAVKSVIRFDSSSPHRIERASLQEQVEPDGDGYYKQPLKQAKPSNEQLDPKKNYKMDALTKGHMFIFNMSKDRKGSDVDVRNVKHVFNEIGYEIEIHSDLTAEQLKEEIRKFVRSPRHKGMCSVVFVLMGHGNKKGTGIKCKLGDTDVVHTNFVVEQVSRMKSMIGKPKMVFLQCCRGKGKGKKVETGQDATDKVTPAKSDVSVVDSTTDEDTGTEEETHEDESDILIPDECDVFKIYATKRGNRAYRNAAQGSWYIDKLCKVLLENAHDTDLCTMIEQATGDVMEKGSIKKAQVLEIAKQGVSKKMYFLPKYSPIKA